jgi:hypothetical protein
MTAMKASPMMMNEDPWTGLSAGSIDARRVSRSGRQNFFWILSGSNEPGLLLKLAAESEIKGRLPRLRSLEIVIRDVDGGRALVVLLKDGEQRELFASLCEDVVRAGESASDNQDALSRAVRRLVRWHHLLRGGSGNLLSLDEQRGLLGELDFLSRLSRLIGPRAAIESWRGPSGASKDFELGEMLIEVKARRGAARPSVQISSEDQLSDVPGARIFLVVSTVDAVIKPDGLTLTDHVRAAERIFAEADTESFLLWDEAIQASGFDYDDDYSERRWRIGSPIDHEVRGDFPRIVTPLLPGVSSVRYSVSLDSCAGYRLDDEKLDRIVMEGFEQ